MKFKQKMTLALAGIALTATNLVAAQSTLLNASYDVAREFYKDYNAAFVAHYKKTSGKDVKIDQAHGGSSAQARAVNDGLDADVVTMNTTTDVDFLAGTGVVAKDWAKRFPGNASPTSSTMLFLVRNGNPKGIKDWDDLVKPGVQVIVVNPKTGGNGRMAYLAAWGSVRKKGGTDAQAAEFVGKVYKNVPVLAKGGRDATTIFLQRNLGDVLVTFESEVVSINREFGEGKVDAVYPSISIVAEGINQPNGLAFSPDETLLYIVESRATPRKILAYDVVDGRTLSDQRVLIEAGAGTPDGFRCDIDGNLWCGWGMGSAGLDGVHVFNPAGTLIGRIDLPERCANLCFGGIDNNRLFMASSHSLYALHVNTRGAV